jgi:hypothetical protein
MPVFMTRDFEDDTRIAHLERSGALIWRYGTRSPRIYVNPTIEDQENKDLHGKSVKAQELMLFAYMCNTIYSPCRSVLRVYLQPNSDYDTDEEEKMLKLTAIEPEVLASLKLVLRRGIYHRSWRVVASLKMVVRRSIYLSSR